MADPGTMVNIAVDGARAFQKIDGFGVNINSKYFDQRLMPAMRLLVDDLGASLYRVDIWGKSNWIDIDADIVVLRQVKAVRRAARRLSAGDLAVRTGLSKGSDDLSQLANAFDTMAAEIEARHADAERAKEALREANEELERCVQERTVHLAVANEAQQIALRDLKRAQDHLDEQQAQLAGIIDSAMEAIITLDEDYRVMVFNREAERVFRVPAYEAIGRPADQFIPERFRSAHMAGLRLLGNRDGTGRRIGPAGFAYALRADGEEFPIEAAVSSVAVRGETLYTIIARDVSERRKRGRAPPRRPRGPRARRGRRSARGAPRGRRP